MNKRPGLWANMRKRRAEGKPKLKPGDKNYPKTLNIEEVPAGANTASIPNPAATAAGPINVTDRRRRKDKTPVLLKRFRKFIDG